MKQFKNTWLFAKVFLKTLEAKLGNRNFPTRLDLNITKHCNLRCSYCYVNFDNLKNTKDMTLEQIKSILDDFYKHGARSVRLMGGEPLMRNDLAKIIDHINKLGILCEINSNGYFVSKRINELKRINSICLSLDGDREANDRIRGKGSYDKVIEAINICQKEKILVRLHSMLSKHTINSIDHIAELAKSLNVSFTYAPCCVPDLDKRDPSLSLTFEEFQSFFKKYLELKHNGYPILSSDKAIMAAINWPFGEQFICYDADVAAKNAASSVVRCQYGRRSCYIDADGMMYACSGQWGVGLNYFTEGFDKCWDYLQKNIKCVSCRTINDLSLATNLDISVLRELFMSFLKGKL